MPLWGITDGTEDKPKYLTQEDKNNTVAKTAGWTLVKTVGSRTQEELLVAVSSGTDLPTALAEATIDAVFFTAATYDQGGSASVTVVYNEPVDVTNGATLTVTGSVTGAITATAAAQTDVTKAVFTFTVPSQTETLSIGAQTISGTIVDEGTSTASDKGIVVGDVVGAGGSGSTKTIDVA